MKTMQWNLPKTLMAAAVLSTTAGLAAQLQAAPAATDRGQNDYRNTLTAAPVPWVNTHGTPMSDDLMPMTLPAQPLELRWHVGKRVDRGPFATAGWLTPFAAPLHPDGVHVWAVSSEGDGFSHVHAVNRFTGQIAWESKPYDALNPDSDESGPSPFAGATNAPTVDVDGNVFIFDGRYAWSYTPDFKLRFKTRYPVVPNADGDPTQITGTPIGQVLVTRDGFVGGAAYSGFWLFIDRISGEWAIAEAMTNPTPEAIACPLQLRALGLAFGLALPELAPSVAPDLTCGAFGYGLAVSESNSLDPNTDFIYQYTGKVGEEQRFVLQSAIIDDPDNPGKKTIETINSSIGLPGGGATTATISLSQNTVVVADGDGAFRAFSLDDMSQVWETEKGNEAGLSPAMDTFGNLVAADRRNLWKFEATSGDPIWDRNYDYLAPDVIPELEPYPLLVPDGTPKSFLLSVQITSPEQFLTTITFGYLIQNPGFFLPGDKVEWYSNSGKVGTAYTDPETGDNLSLSVYDLQGGSPDQIQAPTVDGWLTGQVTDVFGLIEQATFDALLPPRFKSSGPRFGAFALETGSHWVNVEKRLNDCLKWNGESSDLVLDDPQAAFDIARRCMPALGERAIPQEVSWAAEDGEITAEQAALASLELQVAKGAQEQARGLFLAEVYSPVGVIAALEVSDVAMCAALFNIGGDSEFCGVNPPGNGNGNANGNGNGNANGNGNGNANGNGNGNANGNGNGNANGNGNGNANGNNG